MKKFFSALLCLSLVLCMASSAFAAPSITTSDITAVVTDSEKVIVTVTADTPATTNVLAAVQAAEQAGQSVAEVFTGIDFAAIVPEGVNAEDLTMNEILTMKLEAPEAESVTLTFEVASAYEDNTAVIAVIGYEADGQMVWTAVPATVVEGKIVAELSAALVEALSGKELTVALLN